MFIVTAKMDGEKPVIKMGVLGALKEIPFERIFPEMETLINTTGRKEMLLDIERDVPWGVETAILDAAKGNKVHNIINNQRAKTRQQRHCGARESRSWSRPPRDLLPTLLPLAATPIRVAEKSVQVPPPRVPMRAIRGRSRLLGSRFATTPRRGSRHERHAGST